MFVIELKMLMLNIYIYIYIFAFVLFTVLHVATSGFQFSLYQEFSYVLIANLLQFVDWCI